MMHKQPRIYTIATSHLDTAWRWPLEDTLREHLPKTVRENLPLFQKYPQYVFNFEGACRYELLAEYYPDLFAAVQAAVQAGQWRPSGSLYESVDVNLPSPESLFRGILYGNQYFQKQFGACCRDLYLPDCFGFGYALPSVAAHANLLGLTTQKLMISSAYGLPFVLGRWQGPDGSEIFAYLDGRDYARVLKTVRGNPLLQNARRGLQKRGGPPFALILHGVGDQGGAPKEESVRTVIYELVKNPRNSTQVLSAGSDALFRDLAACSQKQKQALPVWNKELVMTDHAVGCYTARGISKRWNRRGEQLAFAAEVFASVAATLGACEYPKQQLDTAYKRLLAHQFHDDITGTANEEVYQRSWNDLMHSILQFEEIYRASVEAVAAGMDTGFAKGVPLLVANPLAFTRRDAVCVELPEQLHNKNLAVYTGTGERLPSQVNANNTLTFCAAVPPMGILAVDVREEAEPPARNTTLRVTTGCLENELYRVLLDENADIASIYDKRLGRELLQKPIRMALFACDGSPAWPMWELDYRETTREPVAFAAHPQVEILENGPARVTLRTVREGAGSRFTQTLSLAAGGEVLRVENEIDWRSLRTLLKTPFSFTAQNEQVTFDLGLGTVRRGKRTKRLYEVPAQTFADITDESGAFGVSILSDTKCGWDKPDERTLRLTGVFSPRSSSRANAHLLDFGINRYAFGILSHAGQLNETTQHAAAAFQLPPAAYWTTRHTGPLGSAYRFGTLSNGVLLRALKQAQQGEELIVRVGEACGKQQPACQLRFAQGITAVREVFADEQPRTNTQFTLLDGTLRFALSPYAVRTFALRVQAGEALQKQQQTPLPLPYTCRITSAQGACVQGVLPNGESLPQELFEQKIKSGSVCFHTSSGTNNALVCSAQNIPLPHAGCVYLLLASVADDCDAVFSINGKQHTVSVPAGGERFAAWDLFSRNEAGFVKDCLPAWQSTHTHTAAGEDAYGRQFTFFRVALPVEAPGTLTLPKAPQLLLLAATLAQKQAQVTGAVCLHDRLQKRPLAFALSKEELAAAQNTRLWKLRHRLRFLFGYARRRISLEVRLFTGKLGEKQPPRR